MPERSSTSPSSLGVDPAGDTITKEDTDKVTFGGRAATGASILIAVGIALFAIQLGIVLMRSRSRKETV